MSIAIILSAHGSMSEQLLKTAEMIVGIQENVEWVNLLPKENTDTLNQKYLQCLSKLNTKNGALFLVDIWGGSPFNTAQRIILNNKNYNIITGVNMPMLLEIFISRDKINSIQELIQIALQCGRDGIKSTEDISENSNSTKNKNPIVQNSDTKSYKNNKKHMTICVARIDDRLIHGQIVTRWTKEYNIQRIIVVNDEISQDKTRTILITQVSPPGISAHVVSIDKAVRVYNNPKYAGNKIIMLFTNPNDILRLIKLGVPISSVNIGNMAFHHGKKQINNVISVDQKDIEAFIKLDQRGVILEIRKVPSDLSLNLMKLIKE